MATVGGINVNVVAKTDRFKRNMRGARNSVRRFSGASQRATATLYKFGGAIAAVVGARQLLLMATSVFRTVDALAKVSDKLGIATEKLAGLQHAAQLSGVATQTFNMGLQRMTRRMAEAAQDTGEAKEAIKQLGLSARHLVTLALDEQFLAVAEALSKVDNQSERVRLAFKLFDSEGVALVNMAKGGREALHGMMEEAERLGIAISRIDAKKIEQANDAITRMQAAWSGVKREVAIEVAPALESAAEWIVKNDAIKKAWKVLTWKPHTVAGTMLSRHLGHGIKQQLKDFEKYWQAIGELGKQSQDAAPKVIKLSDAMKRLQEQAVKARAARTAGYASELEAILGGLVVRLRELQGLDPLAELERRLRKRSATLGELKLGLDTLRQIIDLEERATKTARRESLFESMRSPLDYIRQRLIDANEALKIGVVSWKRYGEVLKGIKADLLGAGGAAQTISYAPVAIRGTVGGYSAALGGSAPMAKMESLNAEQLRVLRIIERKIGEAEVVNVTGNAA